MNKIISILFYFFLAFVIVSCEKEKGLEKDHESTSQLDRLSFIKMAQKQYDLEMSTIDEKSKVSKVNSRRKFSRKTIHWSMGFFQNINKERTLIIPLSIENDIYTKLEDQTMSRLSDLSFLIVFSKGNSFEYEIITKIPDKNYLESDNDNFTGKILIETLSGDFKKGFLLNNQGIFDLYYQDNSNNKGGKTLVEYCNTTDWYACVSVDSGQSYSCGYDYTETVCWGGGTSSHIGGGGYALVGGYTGGSGSTVTGSYSVGTRPGPGKLCGDAIRSTKVGNSWTGTISGLGLTAIDYNTGKVIPVDFPSSCFSIPSYNLTSYQAGITFAKAYNTARDLVERELNTGELPPSQYALRARLRILIVEYLRAFNPGSSFSTAPCTGNVASSRADYAC